MSGTETDSAPDRNAPTTETDQAAPVAPSREVIVERVSQQVDPPRTERRRSVGPFIAGFVTAVVAGAIGLVVFLAVSDSDDDGQLEIDVPAVDVDVDG